MTEAPAYARRLAEALLTAESERNNGVLTLGGMGFLRPETQAAYISKALELVPPGEIGKSTIAPT